MTKSLHIEVAALRRSSESEPDKNHHVHPKLMRGRVSPSERYLVKVVTAVWRDR